MNKARERAQIQEWARRRQPPSPAQLAYTQPASGSTLPAATGTGRAAAGGGLGQTAPVGGGSPRAAAGAAPGTGGAARKAGSAPGQGGRPGASGAGTMIYVIGQS